MNAGEMISFRREPAKVIDQLVAKRYDLRIIWITTIRKSELRRTTPVQFLPVASYQTIQVDCHSVRLPRSNCNRTCCGILCFVKKKRLSANAFSNIRNQRILLFHLIFGNAFSCALTSDPSEIRFKIYSNPRDMPSPPCIFHSFGAVTFLIQL